MPFAGLTKDRAEKLFAKAREALGYGSDDELVLHALRHTTASRLVAAGVDALKVMKFMRHKNVRTTQKYVHLHAEDLRESADMLAQFSVQGGVQKTVQTVVKNESGMPLVGASKRKPLIPKDLRQGQRLDVGLLIRGSLVRAQVGEPKTCSRINELRDSGTHHPQGGVQKSVQVDGQLGTDDHPSNPHSRRCQ